HARRSQQRSNGLCSAPLPSNHFSQILVVHPQLQYGHLRPFDGLHLHVLGMVDEGPGNGFDQLLHWPPPPAFLKPHHTAAWENGQRLAESERRPCNEVEQLPGWAGCTFFRELGCPFTRSSAGGENCVPYRWAVRQGRSNA